MADNHTAISIREGQKERLDAAARIFFNTDSVAYTTTLDQILNTHPRLTPEESERDTYLHEVSDQTE